MHVTDLDGGSTAQERTWTAVITILVVDSNGMPVEGATVNGSWSSGATGSAACLTGSNGTCVVSESDIRNSFNTVSFTVSNVSHAALTYNSAANSDPDGDSDGTTIVVSKP